MRKLTVSVATLATLTAMPALAAGPYSPTYGPETEVEATVSIELGSRTRISDRVYDVRAEGNRRDSRDDVIDEALYKAAQKTLNKDYDWFRVLDRDTDRETVYSDRGGSSFEARYERVPVQRCGLLACSTSYETQRSGYIEARSPERRETRYSVTLEFEMGTGPMPRSGEVYDARLVRRSYR
ncbi:hypothetical protein DES40_2419 [Litorimonas taeanensis]|uniref:Uncharacterized protein n=1 Tax=Litorimonas taeanensis TaxID=568099 RepID=A0A420WF54_9PROT|nr:hypothetical protein [Litorimonas taeanensis]RKQ69616.1 hypothetical protein DES40_2419 [Litorimonas taeanensis]